MHRNKTILAVDWLYYNIMERLVLKKRMLILTVLLLAIGISYFLYLDISFSNKIFAVVDGGIYRSGQLSETSLEEAIKEKGIRTIINLRGKISGSKWYIGENTVSDRYGVKLYDIGLDPNDLPRYRKLMTIASIIEKAEKPILIHCRRGIDRTGMVSAIALAIINDPQYSEIKNQFSITYGVLPFYRSAGPFFFSLYEEWLNKNQKTHSKDTLFHWMRNVYEDEYGNIEFWIDNINGIDWQFFLTNNDTAIPKNADVISIRGWAFDAATYEAVSYLHVTFDNRLSFKADFLHNRAEVARYLGLGEKYDKSFPIGWELNINRDILSPGCHSISLKNIKNGSIFEVPTGTVFCL